MKIAPFVVVLLAIGFATYTQAAPEPLFGLIETAANIIGAGISAIAGAIEGFINGALGGVLTGVLKSGNFGKISVNPREGGCQAENVAKIIDNLFKVLEIPVVGCRSNRDCRNTGIGVCGSVQGIPNAQRICQLTSL
ncbi:hypothetical protein Anas_11974 [Armadillidium nasatum]|uniref:Uncharacterized protein n=1 Tax=Armadillidium nasatum TaxID=96803 RepID=A0A5N5TE08_9CRUS|nr:hypothetical protein Anas_11974 [Armadillidium nasatum]